MLHIPDPNTIKVRTQPSVVINNFPGTAVRRRRILSNIINSRIISNTTTNIKHCLINTKLDISQHFTETSDSYKMSWI